MCTYKLIKLKDQNNKFDISDVIIEFETEQLSDMLETYTEFLRACGYHFDGELALVKEEA